MSFNDCTGQRTGEKGYREAGAIAGGVLVDDTGGGVCQTSSTLFNAVVRADLEIVKRSAHSWPSSYVNKGEDATVNWPSLDFVFRNNGDYPVFVIAWYEKPDGDGADLRQASAEWADGRSRIEVIKTIKPDDAVLYTLDASLPVGTRKAGRKKRTGYVVDTYKVYKDASGNVTEKRNFGRRRIAPCRMKFCTTTVLALRRTNKPKRNGGMEAKRGMRGAASCWPRVKSCSIRRATKTPPFRTFWMRLAFPKAALSPF